MNAVLSERNQGSLLDRYLAVRQRTERLAAGLSAEDCCVQTMPDVSPMKWHLAHVTWFFETFLLKSFDDYQVFHERFEYLFNSYYNAVGEQFPRPQRGLLTRPSMQDVLAYREHVDGAMGRRIDAGDFSPQQAALIELGIHHEQQHQELALMDIKHVLSINPLFPAFREQALTPSASRDPLDKLALEGGVCQMGAKDDEGFCFDNERPRHQQMVGDFALGRGLVRNRDYLEFVKAGGYATASLWLADGWAKVCEEGWCSPLYWTWLDDQWHEFTLAGLKPLDLDAPLVHVSLYEADAFASWAGARLPTEAEWEVAAQQTGVFADGHERGPFQPFAAAEAAELCDLSGAVWQWTRSAYQPYPGFRAADGAVGEYNGKFMCNQNVMRGGACVTPPGHQRPTYRNFFYPHMRWQFGGVRLAF